MASEYFKPATRPPGPDCTDIAAWGEESVLKRNILQKLKNCRT